MNAGLYQKQHVPERFSSPPPRFPSVEEGEGKHGALELKLTTFKTRLNCRQDALEQAKPDSKKKKTNPNIPLCYLMCGGFGIYSD